MRPRTKSVVNVHEYFSHDDGESDQEAEDEDDAPHRTNRNPYSQQQCPWQLRGSRCSCKAFKRSVSDPSDASSCSKSKNASKRERTLTLESWEGTDVDDDDDEAFDDDDDDTASDSSDDSSSHHRCRHKTVERLRTCSHDRRISFDSDVNVVTIPARSSFDADYKQRVWYSHEEYSRMRELY